MSVGCKLFIKRPAGGGQVEERLAEILSIREKPVNKYAIRRKPEVAAAAEETHPDDALEYFVHWDTFNKRLDDWVSGSRLILSRDMEWPRPKPALGQEGGWRRRLAPQVKPEVLDADAYSQQGGQDPARRGGPVAVEAGVD